MHREPRQWLRVFDVRPRIAAAPAIPDGAITAAAAARLGISEAEIAAVKIVRRALDARRRPPRYVYTVDVQVTPVLARRLSAKGKGEEVAPHERRRWRLTRTPDEPRPVVVGAGPAGLMAATLLCEAGWAPIICERGRAVEQRAHDVSKLYSKGVLDPDSNVCFGEGGAGTFSDGKLHTRIGDTRAEAVLATLVRFGARPDILIDNRPHLGTDKLVKLLVCWREQLTALGATFLFERAVEDLELADGSVRGVRLRGGERLEARRVILATGHSARHVWARLLEHGLSLEARPFAVGFRVEHPQALIDEIRYGREARQAQLPAAEYRLTYNERGGEQRGVYSFCMCPGGVVVTTPTEPDALCINGMSHAARSGRFANSALVVTVGPADYQPFAAAGVLAGAAFQESIERAAYAAGGGAFVAPAARLTDFAQGRASASLNATSYRRGLSPADLAALYPAPVTAALRQALTHFERQMRGFITAEATLIGVETRTASPVRVPRGEDMQALGAHGLFPAGEGMGYGGGIVSAAVDGMRAAEALLISVGAVHELETDG